MTVLLGGPADGQTFSGADLPEIRIDPLAYLPLSILDKAGFKPTAFVEPLVYRQVAAKPNIYLFRPDEANGAAFPITDTVTGRTRIHYEKWHEASHYLWVDGNCACDCNRSLFFGRAGGEEPEESAPCDMARYRVPFAVLPDGTVIDLDAGEPK